MAKLIGWVIVILQVSFWLWPVAYFASIGLAKLLAHLKRVGYLESRYHVSKYR